ncbi:MAG: efflux RND transporter permease subunit, partial [Candidatus Melainabacteria bacterium]
MFVNFFIQRPIFSIVCSLIFVLGGIICIPFLPVAQYPEIAPAQISVTANYVGASSEVVESAVTTPLELEINGAEGVRYITSNSSNDGSCSITITIEPGRNADDAIVDIQNRVNRALARLPEEVRTAGITVQKNSNAFISIVGLYADKNEAGNSTYTNYFISNYADKYLKEAIKRIDGVGEVRIFGERKYSMRLWVDPNKMASRNITTGDLVLALREQNVQVAAGQIGAPPYTDGQMFQMSVKAESRLKDAKQFEEIIVKSGSSALVKVKDIGRVELGAESYSSILRFNGNDDVVGLLITQLPSANALDLDTKVKAELKKLSTTFPPGLKYAITLNPTDFVRESIQEVIHTLIEAILLVILVIFFFLQSFRSTLIPAITIPVSLIGTFIFVKIFGFSINTLTLFGLTLATGLVVDDAIVVLENITRFIQEKNMSPLQATFEGMKEITSAVIATSLVLVAVFIPVAFFPGSTGQLYKQFALTIAFSIGISAFN